MDAAPALMQFMRESDPVGAIFAGAQNRPAEELVTALRKGNHLRKYGRRGRPKTHYFRLSHDDRELIWDSSNKKVRSIPLVSVVKVQQGQTTEVFLKDPLPEYEALSFSLIYTEGKSDKKLRSLDVICKNVPEFETWFWGIQLVIAWAQHLDLQQQDLASVAAQEARRVSQNGQGFAGSGKTDDKLQEFKQIAAALQPSPHEAATAKATPAAKPVPCVTAVAGIAAGPTQQRLSGLLGLPEKREIGDCYIWGDWGDLEGFAIPAAAEIGALQSCSSPVMVTNTHALDIIQVAVGARHAALLTRGGEVYTWGSGQGGKLGNGSTTGSFHPYQVTRMSGKGTVSVACGHSYTAAVLADGSLYTWGTGLGGQLGLGPAVLTAVWPMRVSAALDSIRVDKVSCGPFHAAVISSDGRLFTWGDGIFGKLGHGDHASCDSPRHVTALADHWVVSVSCGWWHSAAAAAPRSSRPGHSSNPSADMADGPLVSVNSDPGVVRESSRTSGRTSGIASRGSYATMRSSSMGVNRVAPVQSEMGGWLFTWGGDFTWQQRGKRDHHEGCLGLGDLSGRLLPTVVKGEDDIKQVACGLNFTAALTGNGEVLQMGCTGAENSREHNAMWEGARVPVLVSGQMSTHCAEYIAAGMSHIAVIATHRGNHDAAADYIAAGMSHVAVIAASLRGKPNAAANSSSGPVTSLLTWGQGSRGQLGLGLGDCREDHVLPQVVTAVAGRKILYLACGGHYTLAVCEHDPQRVKCSRDSQDSDPLTSPAVSQNNITIMSGPSRMALGPAVAAATGSASGAGSERGGAARVAAAAGSGGLVPSTSYGSLASSAPSSSRGEAGSGGGGDFGRSFVLRKSDRGKLETRNSDRGIPVHQSLNASQGTMLGVSSRGALSRSLDCNTGGFAGLASSSSVGAGESSKGVSFAANPATIFGGERRGEKGSIISLRDREKGDTDTSMMSLQALAGSSSKRSRLAFTKSLKSVMRVDSNNSSNSSSRHNWSASPNQQGLGKTSLRQASIITNSSVRSETDLMTVSTNSSLSSMTPSASNQSLIDGSRTGEGQGGDNGSGRVTPTGDAAAVDFARQLRYWQERAANMEQQLTRKTHELEQLRQDIRGSSTASSSGQTAQVKQQQSAQAIKHSTLADTSRKASSQRSTPVTQQPGGVGDQQQSAAPAHAVAFRPAASSTPAEPGQQEQTNLSAAAAAAVVSDGVSSDVSEDSVQLSRGTSLMAWMKGRDRTSSISTSTNTSAAGAPPAAAAADAAALAAPQQRSSRRGRSGSAESFKFDALNPAAPTGLETLREIMGGGSSSPAAACAAAAAGPEAACVAAAGPQVAVTSSGSRATSNGSRSMRRTGEALGQGREVVLQDSAFTEMGTHSNEASRVLALFQESQRHRQELAEQYQQQQYQQPPLQQVSDSSGPAAGMAHPVDVESEDVTSGSSVGFLSGVSGMSPGSSPSPQQQQQQTTMGRHTQHSLSGREAAAAVDQRPASAAGAADGTAELQQLREKNRLLQQQLQELQASSPQQQQQQQGLSSPAASQQSTAAAVASPQLLRGVSGTVPVISLVTGPAGTGPRHRHRRTVSVDISSVNAGYLTHEVSPGVFLSLQATESGAGYELKRIRFAKQIYSAADADAWWVANKATVYTAYNIVEPPIDGDHEQQQQQPLVAISSSSRGLSGSGTAGFTVNPAAGASLSAGGAAGKGGAAPALDLQGKWSSTSDISSPVQSPTFSTAGNSSTYELDLCKSPTAARSVTAEGSSRLTLRRSATASSSSTPNSPSIPTHRRLGSGFRFEAATGTATGLTAAQQQQALHQLPGDLHQQQQQIPPGQEGLNTLDSGTAEVKLAGGVRRYSSADASTTTESGSAAGSGRESSSGAAEQKRGVPGPGGIFRLFSRGGGGGDASGV